MKTKEEGGVKAQTNREFVLAINSGELPLLLMF